ncbi:alcohol dehydrogenase catalytic domain-containing protein [Kitasatospora kifunensis]|uniref:NADPH:quinone reductase-like Zn-dependent oxidoreductase n=1 Tax=Kitasatospora kifunensis TaxID=58351 RepID=A0A7W7RB50_KITKI|nr:zinc-binding dehydrogenase [Kitasatospora kifunensis]MBB4928610.1 NADPH:quinone reductase-like Zn-dependent oxidoreductase [Kitasatospora kifunensis]
MRAITYDQQGPATEVLRLAEQAPPAAPAAGHVVVRVMSRPIHPGDLVGVEGLTGIPRQRHNSPVSPGLEGMGVIEAVGEGVTALHVGQRVAFFPVPGAWSESVTVPAEFAVPVPDGVSDNTAALMLVNPLTLLMLTRAVRQASASTAGGPVLQSAAGSTIGKLVNAAAKRDGFPLINLVRSDSGARALQARFPEHLTVSSARPGWRTQVREAAGNRGVPVVLDAVGGSLTRDLTSLMADGGTLIRYGMLGSGSTGLESLALVPRELTIRGVSVGRWLSRTPQERAKDVAFAARLAETDPDLFEVAGTYDLADYAAAIAHVRRPGKSGTVLLTSSAW